MKTTPESVKKSSSEKESKKPSQEGNKKMSASSQEDCSQDTKKSAHAKGLEEFREIEQRGMQRNASRNSPEKE